MAKEYCIRVSFKLFVYHLTFSSQLTFWEWTIVVGIGKWKMTNVITTSKNGIIVLIYFLTYCKLFSLFFPSNKLLSLLNLLCNSTQNSSITVRDACYGCFFRVSVLSPGQTLLTRNCGRHTPLFPKLFKFTLQNSARVLIYIY